MKNNLPVMLLKRIVLLPNQDVRLDLNSDISSRVIDLAINKHNSEILIVCPIDPYEEAPDVSDLPSVGVIGKIKSKMELPNGNIRIVVSGTKAWEQDNLLKVFNKLGVLEDINFIFNFTPVEEQSEITKNMGKFGVKTYFSKYLLFFLFLQSAIKPIPQGL